MAHLSEWMADEGVEPSELSHDRVEQFFDVLKRQWKRPPTAQTLRPMLRWLRECRLVPPLTSTTPVTPLGVLMEQYHDWLVEDRGLAVPTVRRYEAVARRFLQERRTVAGRSTGVEGLSGTDVTDLCRFRDYADEAGFGKLRPAEPPPHSARLADGELAGPAESGQEAAEWRSCGRSR